MKINYHNKRFSPVQTTLNGAVSAEVVFTYKQYGSILSSEYYGGKIQMGQLLGLVHDNGNIEMHYHQINQRGELMTGICFSKPEILENGKIRLYETWQWTSGDKSKGKSVLEEI